jgi:hypothetical protein
LRGRTMQWAAGRRPPIPAAFVPERLAWITAGPAGCGLDRAHWPYADGRRVGSRGRVSANSQGAPNTAISTPALRRIGGRGPGPIRLRPLLGWWA